MESSAKSGAGQRHNFTTAGASAKPSASPGPVAKITNNREYNLC